MPVFLGLAGVAWIVVGALVVADAMGLSSQVHSVLHQQYVTGQLILGAMLASFGMLMLGLAGVIDALRARSEAQRAHVPSPHEVGAAARAAMAHRPYRCG